MTSSLLNCGELEPKWKKMHEKESTLQPKDESDHFGFFIIQVVGMMLLVQQYFHEQR